MGDAPPPAQQPDLLKAWIGFGLAETGQLAIANAHTRDAVGIIARCEARDAAAVKKASARRFFGLI